MIKMLTKRALLMGTLVLGLVFAALAMVFEGADLINFMNGLFLGILFLVGLIWLPAVVRAYRAQQFTRVSQLVVGVACLWLAVALQRILSFFYRSLDKPDWMTDSWAFALVIYLALIGAALNISAPSLDADGRFGKPERRILLVGLPVAVGIALLATYLQANPR